MVYQRSELPHGRHHNPRDRPLDLLNLQQPAACGSGMDGGLLSRLHLLQRAPSRRRRLGLRPFPARALLAGGGVVEAVRAVWLLIHCDGEDHFLAGHQRVRNVAHHRHGAVLVAQRDLVPDLPSSSLPDGAILTELGRCGVPVLLTAIAPPAFLSERVRAYLGMQEDVATRHDAMTCPFFTAGVLGRSDMVLADRLHPNASAIAAVVDAMLPVIERALTAATSGRPQRSSAS
jgi:hypothetical protein